ncbi:hypothetical protein L798_01167 [Zootermopsis nevadensis]|uniref:Uncharacterized protein n=1 Tax=Zootermopsis nevadensis TaxID=136037 RepID=A0A067REV4_ZOONE|nr:hypothetical protein L798_01167 [Zootermopsis nevadensis]
MLSNFIVKKLNLPDFYSYCFLYKSSPIQSNHFNRKDEGNIFL